MAYKPMEYDVRNNPFGWDMNPMRAIRLEDATLEEIEKHYKSTNALKKEFDSIRPSYYFTHGTFKTNPLIEDYKCFLKEHGISSIAIKDN